MSFHKHIKYAVIIVVLLTFVWGCAGSLQKKPQDPDNICRIFKENKAWYKRANSSSRKWGIPISVMMAIMYQESGYRHDAKPPRKSCLFILPGPRPSSAYGYSQALESTWKNYIKSSGNTGAERDDFGDAIDFIGWYCNQSKIKCGISARDSYNQYLAYHEGQQGFNRKTFRKKKWLLGVARNVASKEAKYSRQLAICEKEFRRSCLWPF